MKGTKFGYSLTISGFYICLKVHIFSILYDNLQKYVLARINKSGCQLDLFSMLFYFYWQVNLGHLIRFLM